MFCVGPFTMTCHKNLQNSLMIPFTPDVTALGLDGIKNILFNRLLITPGLGQYGSLCRIQPLVGEMLSNHDIPLLRQRQTEPMFFVTRNSRSIATAQMRKEFKLHTALTVEQHQIFTQNVNADFFLYFALCGLQRSLPLFQTAGHRLPKIRIIAPLQHQHSPAGFGIDDDQNRLGAFIIHY
ncbi:hypothetical [Yersinia pestis KIM10+]|uniref:Uncharacterized protein n=1 Tax=Yersinia pestis TaxID=632 RepID=Q8CL42_YERPE|nr:hypothetical [Yersinia pestis KIM10+]